MTKRIAMAGCLFVAACSGSNGEPTAKPIAYEEMSFDQREVFMTDVVMPKMKETFVAFDTKYEAFTCATCHGQGATDGTYSMPSAEIAPLPNTEEAFFAKLDQDPEFARWSQFMLDKVYPQMAELLQVPLFDPMNQPDGFSCSNCHPHE